LKAAQRNLRVVEKKLEALSETNPDRKEQLELELAAIHNDLGHEQAAKRLCRELLKSTKNETIRQDAERLLSTKIKPAQLPEPPKRSGGLRKGGAQ
jgi:hypothetical protein